MASASTTILVVDDESGVRSMLQRLLELKGYTVLTADDGIECLKKAPAADLILLDIGMPHLGGMSALDKIKNDDKLRHIPVIVVTGEVGAEKVSLAARLGADDFIQKPFRSEGIVHRISKHLVKLDFSGLKGLLLNLPGPKDTGLSAFVSAASGRDWEVYGTQYRGIEVRVLTPPGFEARQARTLDPESAQKHFLVLGNLQFSWKRLWPTPPEATLGAPGELPAAPKAAVG